MKNGNRAVNVGMRARDDVSTDDFADATAGRSAGINRSFDGADFTAHDRRDQPGIDLFPADQRNVGGFHRGVGGFNHRDQAAAFN